MTFEMPTLPEGYFFRVGTLLGSPNLEIRKKTFFGLFSKNITGIWLDDGTDKDIYECAVFLAEDEFSGYGAIAILKANDRMGDYPPKTLG